MSDNAKILNCIVDSLGEYGQEYKRQMRLWFKMLITKEELNREVIKYLPGELLNSHNKLLVSILRKCASVSPPPHSSDEQLDEVEKELSFDLFEPATSLDFECLTRKPVRLDDRNFVMHERVLPDRRFIMRRLCHNALETGLEGSSIASADLLVIATQHFMKNIITAVISRRKGYMSSYNKFVHSLTEPSPNPWSKRCFGNLPQVPDSLNCKVVGNDIMFVPKQRMSYSDREYREMLQLSACQSGDPLRPISLLDLLMTLSIYPSIIASDFLYSVTRERIMAKIDHSDVDL